jgi:SAM-dependent methyltransferase
MALTYHDVRELLAARHAGASFDRTLTIGRQALSLHRSEVRALCSENGLDPRSTWARQGFGAPADAFFAEALGTTELVALDVSRYEGAALLHDLNEPIPADWEEGFDAVVDGGSLEHVFDVRTALSNVMRLARVGGRVFVSTPGSNLLGHGFYQFSPELFYRAFGDASGFRVHGVKLVEAAYPGIDLVPARAAYSVVDADQVGERVGLVSRRPAMVLAHAEKLRHVPDPLAVAPQQSDYTRRWAASRGHHADARGGGFLRRRIPAGLRRRVRGLRQLRRYSYRNRRFFRRLTD